MESIGLMLRFMIQGMERFLFGSRRGEKSLVSSILDRSSVPRGTVKCLIHTCIQTPEIGGRCLVRNSTSSSTYAMLMNLLVPALI